MSMELRYDLLVESIRSGLIEGETFQDAITSFDAISMSDSEPTSDDILSSLNRTLDCNPIIEGVDDNATKTTL